ncbi:MAG: ribonuclease H-like domain-containing protein [Eubacteriales bacterium]
MISNLQQKLASIKNQSPKPDEKRDISELDFACSVFENTYHISRKIGRVPIKNVFEKDINSLVDLCMCSAEEKINLEDIVFFDTETTGLGTGTSTAAFLIGTGYFQDEQFITRQFLMNDYHQESSMIENLNEILGNHKAVVSYNGKAYDSHIVNSRSILNRLPRMLDEKIHLDLLHSARRLYKRRLPSCSMSSIEQNILGVHRVGDIPGSEIPEIFFNYVKYKDDTMLKKVVEHNLQDIISMVAISDVLMHAYERPADLAHRDDIFSQGMIFEKLNFPDKAKLCYNVLENYPPAKLQLACIAKKEGDFYGAVEHFEYLSKMQLFDAIADIELAKIYEHALKDYEKALFHAKKALEKAGLQMNESSYTLIEEIKKRKSRLAGKLSLNRKEN